MPMIYLLFSAAAPEYSGALTATVFLSSTEEVLDSGLLLVDVEYFVTVNLSAATSSEEVLDSGLVPSSVGSDRRLRWRTIFIGCVISASDGRRLRGYDSARECVMARRSVMVRR